MAAPCMFASVQANLPLIVLGIASLVVIFYLWRELKRAKAALAATPSTANAETQTDAEAGEGSDDERGPAQKPGPKPAKSPARGPAAPKRVHFSDRDYPPAEARPQQPPMTVADATAPAAPPAGPAFESAQ